MAAVQQPANSSVSGEISFTIGNDESGDFPHSGIDLEEQVCTFASFGALFGTVLSILHEDPRSHNCYLLHVSAK